VAGRGDSNTLYPRALLWKNGTLQALTAVLSYASANSVHVSGSDAFVAGQEELKAKVWRNGKEHNSQAKGESVANSVFAVKGGEGPTLDTRPTKVTLNKAALQLGVGAQEKLTAAIEPWYATSRAVTWSSNNPNAASVASDGTVTAHSQGAAAITVTTVDGGKTATCQVTVADVLVAGWRNVSGRKVATLWTNKQPQSLTNGTYESTAESVYSTGTDVFVAGCEQGISGKSVARVWRNGSLYQNLSNGAYDAAAYSICVANSNVYVAGIEYNSQGRPVATLWTNGTARRLADDTYSSYAYSVTTSGSDVYVAGEYRSGTRQVAAIWKNSALQALGNEASNSVASNVAAANGRVYVAGTEVTSSNMQNAVLWTDGAYRRISDGRTRAMAHGLAVSGGSVYLSGGRQEISVSSYNFPIIWKDGERQGLSPGLSLTIGGYARSVFVFGDSIYAAGVLRDVTDKDYAFMWVNGEAVSLGGLGEGRGIFVR